MANNQPGTTNADAPFQPGEVVEFCGERYTVVSNRGDGGMVTGEQGLRHFWWAGAGGSIRRAGNPKEVMRSERTR